MLSFSTVLGDIDPNDLGVTLAHEHLVIDAEKMYKEKENENIPMSFQNLFHKMTPPPTPMGSHKLYSEGPWGLINISRNVLKGFHVV